MACLQPESKLMSEPGLLISGPATTEERSVVMSVCPVTPEGHAEACSLKPYLRVRLPLGPYRTG